MHWQYLTLALLVVGPLAACHSGGDVAPDGKAPTPPAVTTETAPASESAPLAEAPIAAAPASPTAPAPAPDTTTSPAAEPADPAEAECKTRRDAIESALNDAAHCTKDADCTTTLPGCPFGCFRPVNKDVSLTQITADIEAYNKTCNQCMYRCIPPKDAPKCSAGRCTGGV